MATKKTVTKKVVTSKLDPKQKKLAAMSGDNNKITRGDVIKAAQMNKGK